MESTETPTNRTSTQIDTLAVNRDRDDTQNFCPILELVEKKIIDIDEPWIWQLFSHLT